MEKGCTLIVGNIFLVLRQSFFLDTFFCLFVCKEWSAPSLWQTIKLSTMSKSVFLFHPILWCCHNGDHPQGDLATFGYRPAMKVEKNYKNPFVSWLLVWTMCRNIAFFKIEGNIQLYIYNCQMMKIHPKITLAQMVQECTVCSQ
jgi:hypothetical protein